MSVLNHNIVMDSASAMWSDHILTGANCEVEPQRDSDGVRVVFIGFQK